MHKLTKENILLFARKCKSKEELSKYFGIHYHTLTKYIKKMDISKEVKFLFLPKKMPDPWNKGLTKDNDKRIKKYYSDTRKGKNNPMFGKMVWNKGLTKYSDDRMMKTSQSSQGKKLSDSHIKNLSKAAKKRKIHGMKGKHHSEETRKKIRQKTIKQMSENKMPHTNTRPHRAVKEYLISKNINFVEEQQIGFYSVDFKIDNLIIEVQGDYWHSNPKFYPNGPKTKAQKINFYRDISKRKYLKKKGLILLEIWENEINEQIFMEKINNAIECS